MNKYYFTTTGRIEYQVIVEAETEEEAWENIGSGEQTETDYQGTDEQLDYIEKTVDDYCGMYV